MPDTPSFPPLGDPDRYDQIVRRGRSLRRTRRLGMSAGAGGGAAAVVVAVVLFAGSGPDGGDQIAADGVDAPTTVSTTTTTTTTTTLPPPTEYTVTIDASDDEILIDVTDPAAPVSEDTHQCVTVTLSGEAFDGTTETTACDDVPAVDGVVDAEFSPPDGVEIGCAVVEERIDPHAGVEFPTELRSTTFRLGLPDDLDPGEYTVDVSAVSGIGDGCVGTEERIEPGATVVGSIEREERTQATFTVD